MPTSHVVKDQDKVKAWSNNAPMAIDFSFDMPVDQLVKGRTGTGTNSKSNVVSIVKAPWSSGVRADIVAFIPRPGYTLESMRRYVSGVG